jgi:hypothetical protein
MKYWLLALSVVGCSGSPSDGANPDPKCHPLAVGDCLLPWPSAYFQKADSSTVSGFRLALPEGVLPKDPTGKAMDPSALNRLDGFSPAGPLVANLKVHLDPAQLPPEDDLAKSLAATATVQLFAFDTLERVPLFAEVDKNAFQDEDQVLLIHPQIRLQPKTRYLVALQNLVDDQGNKIVNQPFEALKSGAVTSENLRKLSYQPIFDKLTAAGIDKSGLTLAWDFVTGSDEQLTGHLIEMRDQAITTWQSLDLGYEVTQVNDPTDDHLLRELLGTFSVPSFLASDALEAVLQYDSDGNPQYRAPQNFPLVVHVPKCAETAPSPLPFLVFGHGLFGKAKSEMNSSYQKRVIDELCMVQVGTDWIGLSDSDIPNVAKFVVPDFTRVDIVTDRLQQAQINFVILARLAIQKLKDDPNLALNGKPISDGSQIYYYGISQGGIEGGTFMGITPDVLRGVLNVPGAAYSFMVTRSVDFRNLKSLLNVTYPLQRDQEVLLALSQSYWDFSDPITFAPYSLRAPLPGLDGNPLPARHILMQEAIHDSQVPNLATRVAVRTMGLPLLETPVETVYGVEVKAGPLDSAYTQWDVHGDDLSNGNIPPPVDNEVHGAIRKLPALVEQLRQFFRPDGQVVHTCTGACVYDAP